MFLISFFLLFLIRPLHAKQDDRSSSGLQVFKRKASKGSGTSVTNAIPTTLPLTSPEVKSDQPVIDAPPLAVQFLGGRVITLSPSPSSDFIPFVPPDRAATSVTSAAHVIYLVYYKLLFFLFFFFCSFTPFWRGLTLDSPLI